MKKENALITQESTEVVLRKATNIMSRTNKILKNSKKALATHPDVMMINGLMWQKETVEEEMNWDDAMEYAKNLRLGGYDDWRLPTIEELMEIVSSCGIEICFIGNECPVEGIEKMIKNKNNKLYQSCYTAKGFLSTVIYISCTKKDNKVLGLNYRRGTVSTFEDSLTTSNWMMNICVRCVRETK